MRVTDRFPQAPIQLTAIQDDLLRMDGLNSVERHDEIACVLDVDHQLGVEHGQRRAITVAQAMQVLGVVGAVWEMNVQTGERLLARIVVELVDGKRDGSRLRC